MNNISVAAFCIISTAVITSIVHHNLKPDVPITPTQIRMGQLEKTVIITRKEADKYKMYWIEAVRQAQIAQNIAKDLVSTVKEYEYTVNEYQKLVEKCTKPLGDGG